MAEEQTNEQTAAAAADESVSEVPPAEPSPAAEPAESLTPQERKQRARVARAAAGRAREPMTPEQRQAERVAERRRKAGIRRARRPRERARATERSGRSPGADPAPREHQAGAQKTRQGIVVSDRADKTITVRIDIVRRHRRYAKIVHSSRTLRAHDERNDARIGDTVIVRESRPLSRSKRWRLVSVVERAQ